MVKYNIFRIYICFIQKFNVLNTLYLDVSNQTSITSISLKNDCPIDEKRIMQYAGTTVHKLIAVNISNIQVENLLPF